MNGDDLPSDLHTRPKEEDFWHFQASAIKAQDRSQPEHIAQQEEVCDSLDESEDLEALSDEDAGDFSHCTSSEHLTQAHDIFSQNYPVPDDFYSRLPFEIP